jgi:hypothetical protein
MTQRKKLIVRLAGGLGNQLFTYSAARRLATVNGAELVVDHKSGFYIDRVYKQRYQLHHFRTSARLASYHERFEPFSRIRRAILRAKSRRLPFSERHLVAQDFIAFDARLLDLRFEATRYFEGYWQSERYFKDIADQIREELTPTPPNDPANTSLLARIVQDLSVALHVRFFDTQSEPSLNNIETEYYARAITLMKQRFPGASYFLFSDDLDRATRLAKHFNLRAVPSEQNSTFERAYADLWLMSHCKHFIIANSTFSWWGAWLSKNADKLVISPGVVQGTKTAWGFEGLIPETWHVIDNL